MQDPFFGSLQGLWTRKVFNRKALLYSQKPVILEGAGELPSSAAAC